MAVLLLAAVAPLRPALAQPAPSADAEEAVDLAALARLDRAVEASRTVPHRGTMTVVSFSTEGPQITTVELLRGVEGRLRVEHRDGWELGRDEEGEFLRSSRTGTLLRVGAVERSGFDRDRFVTAYAVADAGSSDIDTGPARALEVRRRSDGHVREILHVDDATGLIARRETFGADGAPVRLVAFTSLVTEDVPTVTGPAWDGDVASGGEVVDQDDLLAAGIPAPTRLRGGFELVGRHDVAGTDVPTVRLVYDDGLYTLSLFIQEGRLAGTATEGATRVEAPGGGTVWRWAGSEPRRVVWTGGGRTFTALSDAPTEDVVAAVAELPNDPPPSTLERLTRGLSRVVSQLIPPWDD